MMGWSDAQWKAFCGEKGINAIRAIATGQADLDPKDEQRAKKRTKRAPAPRVSHTVRKQDPNVALEPPISRTQPLMADPGRCPRVRIIIRGCRLRFLDQDNFIGSCKALVDGLVRAGIASDDSEKARQEGEFRIDYEQQLVTSSTKECTEIELIWRADVAGE
jgi:hypothetical protein